MERTLSLVLDDRGLLSLTLFKADNVTMDEYTTKNFESSDEIREKYKNEIDKFLKENENYINAIKAKTGKEYNGRIVLLQVHHKNIMELEEKKVLYKKHLVAFKELCKDRGTMQGFSKLEKIGCDIHGLKKLISPHIHKEINYNGTFKIKSRVSYIERELRKDKKEANTDFYEILRIMLKSYQIERQTRPNLPTINKIYKDYLNEKEMKKFEREKQKQEVVEERQNIQENNESNQTKEEIKEVKTDLVIETEEEKNYYVNGFRYSQEERELFDIDDFDKNEDVDSDFRPDGLGKK